MASTTTTTTTTTTTQLLVIWLLAVAARISAAAVGDHEHENEHFILHKEIEALENSMEAMLQKMERMEQNLMEPLKNAIALGATKEEIEKNIIEPLVVQALTHGQSQKATTDSTTSSSKEIEESDPSIPGIKLSPVIQEKESIEPEINTPGDQIAPVIRQSQSIKANDIQRNGPSPNPQRIVPKPQIIKLIPDRPSQVAAEAGPGQPRTSTQVEWIDVIPSGSGSHLSGSLDDSSLVTFPVAAILRYRVSYPENGRFQYEFETENGIKQRSEGYPGEEGQSNMRGAFSWPTEGGVAQFSYEADENGYRVQSNMLPVAPAAPSHVPGLIAMAQEQKAKGIVFN